MRRLASMLFLAAGLAVAASHANAESWPSRPIRIIVPYPPGGTTDTAARPIAQHLSRSLGVPVIVENRPGAGGTTGTAYAAHSAPDGYTLLLGNDSLGLQPHLVENLGYDPLKDLAGVAQLSRQPLVIAAHPSLGVKTLQELIALGRSGAPGLAYGTSGVGNSQHLVGAWFAHAAQVNWIHVPYKGGGQAVTDFVGGQVPCAVLGIAPVMPFQRAGKVRILAVTTRERSPFLPDVPTLVESGFAEIYVEQWTALFAPAGTPRAIIERLNNEVDNALRDPTVIALYESLSMMPVGGRATDLDRLLREDHERYGRLVKEFDIREQ
jgi:tripartite-type tricarboxylate transporter receptor subunit TctC